MFRFHFSILAVATLLGCSGTQGSPSPMEPVPVATVIVESESSPDAGAGTDKMAVSQSGILGLLSETDAGLGNLFGDSIDDFGLTGDSIGDSIGDSYGYGGLVGVGSIRASGEGGGTYGLGRLGGTGAVTTRPTAGSINPGDASVTGRLDKDVIRRVIRRSLPRIQYCYERELAKDPTLQGRASVRFVIGANGAVTGVLDAGSTLPSESAKACIHQVISALMFPRPEGGGVVIVTYPFLFAPSQPTDAGVAPLDAGTAPVDASSRN